MLSVTHPTNIAQVTGAVHSTFQHSRGTIGRYVDANGVVRTAAAGVLRNAHHILANDGNTYRVTLLERAYTNLVSSDDIKNDWPSVGTPLVSVGVDDPAGGTSAFTVADDSGSIAEVHYDEVTYTGDAVKSATFVVRGRVLPATGAQRLQVYDTDALASRLQLSITAYGDDPTIGEGFGSLLGRQPLYGDWWLISGQLLSVVAANQNLVYVYPSTTGTETGSIDIYVVNTFDARVPPPSLYLAGETHTADAFTIDLLDPRPQAATYLYEGVVLDLPNQGVLRYLYSLGGAATSTLGVYYRHDASQLFIAFHNGTAQVQGSWNVSLELNDYITVRVVQAADGAITAGLGINDAAEDTTLDSAISTQALPSAWANDYVRIGNTTGVATCNNGLISFKAQSGSKSLVEMLALGSANIAYYHT